MSKGHATKILRRAHDLLFEERNWMKGDYRQRHGNQHGTWWVFCSVGAMREARDLEAKDGTFDSIEDEEKSWAWAMHLLAEEMDPGHWNHLGWQQQLLNAAENDWVPDLPNYENAENAIIHFNDGDHTTYQDVVDRLEKALKLADERGL